MGLTEGAVIRAAVAWSAAVAAVAACNDPQPKLVLWLPEGGAGASCPATTCSEIPMACDTVLHVRLLSTRDTLPVDSICRDVMPNARRDLCAIASIDLNEKELTREILEVQVTVWPKHLVFDPETGLNDCQRVPVEFDAINGFPIGSPAPAFGGRGFYRPGDEEVDVVLGCTNYPAVNSPACSGVNEVDVATTVLEFEDLPKPVSPEEADKLSLWVGEPAPMGGEHILTVAGSRPLTRLGGVVPPRWEASVDLSFMTTACLQVTEVGAETTTSVRCKHVTPEDRTIDFAGVRVLRDTLNQVLAALGEDSFPAQGLTLGIVIDQSGTPATGVTVTATTGTIKYPDENRATFSSTGPTSANGIFVSTDAEFGTAFNTAFGPTIPAVGGLIAGKLTIVVLDQGQIVQ